MAQFFTLPDKVEEKGVYDDSKPDQNKKIDWLKNNSLAYSILMLSQSDIVTLYAVSCLMVMHGKLGKILKCFILRVIMVPKKT
jgi:hypothetical protein